MTDEELENLQQEIYQKEENLDDNLRSEYFKRKRFLGIALEQYIRNSIGSDECNGERAILLNKANSLRAKFICVAVLVAIVSWLTELEIELCLLLMTLVLGYFSQVYVDIKIQDTNILNNYGLIHFDKQVIERELASYGIDPGSLQRYVWDTHIVSGKHVSYEGFNPKSVDIGEAGMQLTILKHMTTEW